MKELLATNDIVALSFVEALLREAGIPYEILDTHMSIMDGSLGILPRRVVVDDADLDTARTLMGDAGLPVSL